MIANHPIYGVIGYHVTLSVTTTPYKETLVHHLVATSIYLSQIYSYYIRGDSSPLTMTMIRHSLMIYVIDNHHGLFNLILPN